MDTSRQWLRTGVALAVTVAFAYTACALFFWLLPDPAIGLANAIFHGLDFRKLQAGSTVFNFGGFFYAFIVLTIWAFVLGAVFECLRGRRSIT